MVKIDKTTKALADRYYAEQCRKLGTKGMPRPPKEPDKPDEGPWTTPRSWKAVSEALAACGHEGGIGKTATIHIEDDPAKWLAWANETAPKVDLQAIWEHFNAL